MTKWLFTMVVYMFAVTEAETSEKAQALLAIETLFSAMSAGDYQAMNEKVTPAFILLEHGEIWSISDLINVASATEAIRAHYFNVISIDIYENTAVVNYWNKAHFNLPAKREEIIWLESAVLHKNQQGWLLSQMHSTRLPAGTTPKGVSFTSKMLYLPLKTSSLSGE